MDYDILTGLTPSKPTNHLLLYEKYIIKEKQNNMHATPNTCKIKNKLSITK